MPPRKIAPESLITRITSDGKIQINTVNLTQFRLVKATLLNDKFEFHSFKLAQDHILKVLIKGIPTNISTDKIKTELELLNLNVQLVKQFIAKNKPRPISLVLLTGENAKNIYELSNLFYLKVTIKTYKRTGVVQCLVR